MKIRQIKILNKPLSLYVVSIILFAVSFEGVYSFPGILKVSQSLLQYVVVFAHASYVLASILIIIGLWRTLKVTPTIVIIWGIFSLVAALGGPLAFSVVRMTFQRTASVITVLIAAITYVLFIYTRHILKNKLVSTT